MAEVEIKKYANRRLYDATHSRYVNLDDVAGLIREGHEVRVVEAGSGEDITRLVLTQIILEDARSSEGGLPVEVLRRMVAASDASMQQFLDWYLDTALEGYRKASDAFREHLGRVGGGSGSPLEMMQRGFDPARMIDWFGGRRDHDEVADLRRRLAELEQRLAAQDQE